MSGEIVVAVIFVEALVVAALLLVLPLTAIGKGSPKPSFANCLYFLAVGAGFMFVELFFIKKYIFIFGDPVVSFTVVLAGVLASSGLGGYWSQRIDPRSLRLTLTALIAVLALVFFGLDLLIQHIIRLSIIMRYLIAMLLLVPAGLLAGLPFPLGMRYLLKSPGERAYAWAANGCASVLASIAAAQIALSLGIPTIIACGIAAYMLAFISAKMEP
jgi:predicted membrane-bound spermidine synthase